MHECLFCGKTIRPEDVLFGTRKDDDGSVFSAFDMPAPKQVMVDSGNSSFLSDDNGAEDHANDAPIDAAPQKAEPEANIELGKWVIDTPHQRFLDKYLYMDQETVHRTQMIFAVRWSKDECAHRVGRADGQLRGGVPITVRLSPEDAEKAGGEYLTTCFCPHCHCEIMPGFMEAEASRIHHIAFVGGSRAGKTQYLTAIYQNMFEISSLMNDYRIGTVEMDSLSKSVMQYLSGMFSSEEREGHMETTQIRPILPVVMSVKPMGQNGKIDNSKRSFIAIYDCPGEIFNSRHVNAMVSQPGLRKAEALLFMVDPAQLFRALDSYAREDEGRLQDTCVLNLVDMVQRFSEYFPNNHYKAASFVITKMDQVIERNVCSLSKARIRPGTRKHVLQSKDYLEHNGGVDMGIINLVNNELRHVLRSGVDDQDGVGGGGEDQDSLLTQNIIGLVEENLTGCATDKLKVFAVSTHSRPSDDEAQRFEKCGVANRERHRLLEPLLYLWAELGVVATKNGGGSEASDDDNSGDGSRAKPHGFWGRLFGR